jgi:ubiquitin-protein ligase
MNIYVKSDFLPSSRVSLVAVRLSAKMGAVLPRSFRLLEELEKGEKGISLHNAYAGLGDGSCSYGLADSDDIMMSNWNGTILGPPHVYPLILLWRRVDKQSVHENRIYSLKIVCGNQYPDVAPQISFTSKINLPCVNPTNGRVSPLYATS